MPARPRFEIERELGRGGAGVVWLALDQGRGGERVALKRLAAGADPEALRREFEVLVRLRHPVIVAVRDFGRDEQGPFLTMEYVDGQDLGAGAGKHSPERVTGWALLLADALEYARRRGIVHGDIKPENVLVPAADPAGLKLLDLGFARLAGDRATGGTPEYLAPEVMAGAAPDSRADLFALGCVLYHCLTGAPPFAGYERSRPPRPLPDGVPGRLRHVIELLLKPRPDERPGRPADLVLLLGDAPGLRLPLPEGDLVGRDAAIEAARGGGIVLLEAEPGMGASRLLREIGERRDTEGARGRIAVYRPGTAPVPVDGRFRVVCLPPLGLAAMERLVASRLPLEAPAVRAIAAWVERESAGSPALAIDALECLRDSGLLRPGPLGLECEVEGLEALRPEARPGSRAAASVAKLTEGERTVKAERAVTDPPPGEPETLRRALESTLAPARRAALHAEAAARLITLPGPDPAAVADHLIAAGQGHAAGPWLVRAAERARAAGSRREARRRLEAALELLPGGAERAAARLDLAREQVLAGDSDAALASFAAAREENEALAADCYVGEAEVHAARKDHRAARVAAVSALRGARGAAGAPAERTRAGALLVLGRITAGRAQYAAARRHLDGALCLYRALGDHAALARAALNLGNTAFLSQQIDEALAAYHRARDAAREAGDRRLEGLALQNLGMIYAYHRRSAGAARPALEAAVAVAEADGDSGRLARALSHLAVLDLDSGGHHDALRHVERAMALRAELGDQTGLITDRMLLGEILTVCGRFAEAHSAFHGALEAAVELGDRRREACILEELGRHALDVRDPISARSCFEKAIRIARATGERATSCQAQAGLAVALLALGDVAAARLTLDGGADDAGNDAQARATLARAVAAVRAAEGRFEEAVRVLEEALGELRESGFELEMARTLLSLGTLLGERGRGEAALEALERARVIFDRQGAKPSLARTLLAKATVKLKAADR